MDSRRLLDALVGVYVSLVVVTASALLQWNVIAPTFSVGKAVVIGLAIAAVVAGAAGTVDDLAERMASIPTVVVIVGVPLLSVPYIFATDPGSTAEFVATIGGIAVLPGIGVLLQASSVRNRRLCETATEIVVVTVGDAENNTELTVTDIGLQVTQSVSVWGESVGMWDKSVSVWDPRDQLTGYRLTDDEIIVAREQWYLPARRFKREAISDEDALIEGLEQFLPRLDTYGRVERTPRRQ